MGLLLFGTGIGFDDVIEGATGIGESIFGASNKAEKLAMFRKGNVHPGEFSVSQVQAALQIQGQSAKRRAAEVIANFSGDYPQNMSANSPVSELAGLVVSAAHGGFDGDVGGREDEARQFVRNLLSRTDLSQPVGSGGGGGLPASDPVDTGGGGLDSIVDSITGAVSDFAEDLEPRARQLGAQVLEGEISFGEAVEQLERDAEQIADDDEPSGDGGQTGGQTGGGMFGGVNQGLVVGAVAALLILAFRGG